MRTTLRALLQARIKLTSVLSRQAFLAIRLGAACIMWLTQLSAFVMSLYPGAAIVNYADISVRRRPARWLCAGFVGLASFISLSLAAVAQDTAVIDRGDAAVTAFSGAKQFG